MAILGKEKRRTTNKVMGLFLFFAVMTMCQQERTEAFMVIAHRGASRVAPENTLAAMKKAIEFGADYAECDVFQTRDGELVLFHDQEMERTTGKAGMIWDYTLADLKAMEAGSWFGEEFMGEPIPTLREVLQLVKGKMNLDIEVKVSGEDFGIAKKVVDVIRSENMTNECMVTSFEKTVIVDVKQTAPELRTGYIFDEEHPPDIFEGDWEYVCSKHDIVNKAFVRKARRKGKKVFVWTVDNPEVMKKMIDVGVDGIITDVPDVLKQVIKSIERND